MGAPLSPEELLMDGALAAIYGGPGESFGGRDRAGAEIPPPPTLPSGWGTCAPL